MGSFKLAKMTLRGLFTEPETVQYPTQSKPVPEGLKGHIVIDVGTCILCGICVKRCPAGAIAVDKDARSWSVNGFRCIQCGLCVQECPKRSLSMDPTYTLPATSKQERSFEVLDRKKITAE